MTIDLKRKQESTQPAKYDPKAPVYPTMYLSGLGDIDLEDGQEVTISGIVKEVVKTESGGKTTYSCQIEAQSLDCDECEDEGGDDGIDNAMRKIEKKKAKIAEQQDEGD